MSTETTHPPPALQDQEVRRHQPGTGGEFEVAGVIGLHDQPFVLREVRGEVPVCVLVALLRLPQYGGGIRDPLGGKGVVGHGGSCLLVVAPDTRDGAARVQVNGRRCRLLHRL
ncbi:hypothetical protein [Streptomyces rochei]|uniref:hypothetical protein n=1 Tax=Streptomyces rochei TaxID=1928 RepID=UPI0036B1E574